MHRPAVPVGDVGGRKAAVGLVVVGDRQRNLFEASRGVRRSGGIPCVLDRGDQAGPRKSITPIPSAAGIVLRSRRRQEGDVVELTFIVRDPPGTEADAISYHTPGCGDGRDARSEQHLDRVVEDVFPPGSWHNEPPKGGGDFPASNGRRRAILRADTGNRRLRYSPVPPDREPPSRPARLIE